MTRRNRRIAWISRDDPPMIFPPVDDAMREPNGLLAAGGDLSPARVLHAYRHGIFPWYDKGQPILWWSPDPRCVLMPGQFRLSRRFRRDLKNSSWELHFNTRFESVIDACAAPRRSTENTWITPEMREAFCELHQLGWAHSAEIFDGEELIGGVYGLAIDRVFFGESMFSKRSNASKAALFGLCELLWSSHFEVLDCQVISPHLLTLGACRVPRSRFTALLQQACTAEKRFQGWPVEAVKLPELLERAGSVALQ